MNNNNHSKESSTKQSNPVVTGFKPVSPQVDFPAMERDLLKKWYQEGIVEQYLHKNDAADERFSFLDGPITANNPMGVHHAWGRTYKDIWQRFWNMRGKKQRFQNGFDCQGLWVEVEVEKELGVRNKKDIETLVPGDRDASIAKFVELCKERVRTFSAIQTEQSKRLGYFMNWDNSYFTMSDENNYMIWYFLKTCHEKGWIYKGKDSVPWCPRCETAISQHEMLTEDYKELTHETIFVKLPITTSGWDNTSLLIWTTTPWTMPANVAVGVNVKYTYGVWENKETEERVVVIEKDDTGNIPTRTLKGKELPVADYIFSGVEGSFEKVKELKGGELVGLTYETPFDTLPLVQQAKDENPNKFHSVIDASEIVVAAEGTGLLHVSTGAGKEDFDLGKKENLTIISPITDDATYVDGMSEFSGKNAKKHPEIIIDFLRDHKGGRYLLKSMGYTHRYPACWRCKAELVWKVAEEWYIGMDIPENVSSGKPGATLREQMKMVAKQIEWHPGFGLDRELDWLSNMHDWLISKKNRYWGLALPIYECQKCGKFQVIGGKEELKEKAVAGWDAFEGHSPHKPFIDAVKIACSCQEVVSRIADVGNVWLDAGIVPFSTYIDPQTKELSYITDKSYWKEWFPVDFITESFPGQFKNWFYSLIAMSTVLEKKHPFKTVLGYASMLAEDGRPMHKSWGNSIEFNEGADKIGVDVMRWMYATHDPEQNLLFGYKKADETRRRFHLMLWNIYNFFITYANTDGWEKGKEGKPTVLDTWVLIRLNMVIRGVTHALEKYDVQTAALTIESFVNRDLSLWYIRRSRDRVGADATDAESKNAFYTTTHTVLTTIARLLMPFLPFVSDEMYTNLTGEVSVHLADWPVASEPKEKQAMEEQDLLTHMDVVRTIAETGQSQRKQLGIKVRQPLGTITYTLPYQLNHALEQLFLDELNVKEAIHKKGTYAVKLDATLTDELKAEGQARDIIRSIQEERKKLGTKIDEQVDVVLPSWPEMFESEIKRKALIRTLTKGEALHVARL